MTANINPDSSCKQDRIRVDELSRYRPDNGDVYCLTERISCSPFTIYLRPGNKRKFTATATMSCVCCCAKFVRLN